MQFSSPKTYLKELKIQRFYVNKFMVNYANHNNLTNICKLYISNLDNEIKDIEDFIAIQDLKNSSLQVNIYDFIDKE